MTWTDGIILCIVIGIFIGIIVNRASKPKGCQCQQVKHFAKLKEHYRRLKENEIQSTNNS